MREGGIESELEAKLDENVHQIFLWKDKMAPCFVVHSFMICLHVKLVSQEQGGMNDHWCCCMHMASFTCSEGGWKCIYVWDILYRQGPCALRIACR